MSISNPTLPPFISCFFYRLSYRVPLVGCFYIWPCLIFNIIGFMASNIKIFTVYTLIVNEYENCPHSIPLCWEYSQNVTHTISIIAFPPVTRHTPMYMYRQYMYMYNNNYCATCIVHYRMLRWRSPWCAINNCGENQAIGGCRILLQKLFLDYLVQL